MYAFLDRFYNTVLDQTEHIEYGIKAKNCLCISIMKAVNVVVLKMLWSYSVCNNSCPFKFCDSYIEINKNSWIEIMFVLLFFVITTLKL